MAATSLKLSNELRQRISALVKGTNQTAHAFMVEAIERAAKQEELRRAFGEERSNRSAKPSAPGSATLPPACSII